MVSQHLVVESGEPRPEMHIAKAGPNPVIELNHPQVDSRWLHCEGSPELLFTENDTNAQRLFGLQIQRLT